MFTLLGVVMLLYLQQQLTVTYLAFMTQLPARSSSKKHCDVKNILFFYETSIEKSQFMISGKHKGMYKSFNTI